MQRDQTMHRTHELHVGAVRALIGHDLRDRQLGERFVERGLQAVGERGAGRRVAQEERFGLAVLRAFEIVQRKIGEAERGEFLRERRGGLAVLVERDGNRQHFFAHLLFRRDRAHVLDRARRGGAAWRNVRTTVRLRSDRAPRDAATMPSANASPRRASAFGGSSSVSSSTSRVA